jgi:hypothetical protein
MYDIHSIPTLTAKFDKKMNHQNQNIVLFLDNTSCYAHQLDLKNVKLQFLPPSTTNCKVATT